MAQLALIAAMASNGVIGRNGQLPWHLPADLAHFKRTTMGKTMVMGRITWESLGAALPNRKNVVLTAHPDKVASPAIALPSLDVAIALTSAEEEIMVIGGAHVYQTAIEQADRLYITHVHANVEGDTHFPPVKWAEWEKYAQHDRAADDRHQFACSFCMYRRIIN